MKLRVPIGYKFILGFILVVAVSAFVPDIIDKTEVVEWMKEPISFLVAILVGLILGTVFSKTFTRNFSRLTFIAGRISHGDLTYKRRKSDSPAFTTDESTDLEEALILMIANLKDIVIKVQETTADIVSTQSAFQSIVEKSHETSNAVTKGSSKIFDGAIEQANHIETTSRTVRSMSELADNVTTKVTDTANASQKVNSIVQKGTNTATGVIENMEKIFSGIEKTEGAATKLESKFDDISRILDLIIHISRQTDILAMNATIEASKAGEHGKGFAMVAEEVRHLADSTGTSVEDVSEIVKTLKNEMHLSVQYATENSSYIKEGRDDIRKIRDVLNDISDYTEDVVERANTITTLSDQQKDKAESAVNTIEEVAKIAKSNLSVTANVETAIEEHVETIEETLEECKKLSTLSEELNSVLSRFKVE